MLSTSVVRNIGDSAESVPSQGAIFSSKGATALKGRYGGSWDTMGTMRKIGVELQYCSSYHREF